MAKKKSSGKIVTVNDLCDEYKIEARQLRIILRANGLSAKEVEGPLYDKDGNETKFGPRKKYTWEEGSKELAEVRDIIEDSLVEAKSKKKKAKADKPAPAKGKKAPVEEPDEDDDEDDDDIDDEDEDDEDDEDEPAPPPKKGKKK